MDPNKLFQNIRLGWSPIFIIAVTTLATIAISIYCLSYGWVIIFQNLFYVPIVIACVFYTKRGFAFSIVLSIIYFFLIIAFTRDSAVIMQALIRVFIFVGVAGITTYLSIKRKQMEKALSKSEKRYESFIAHSNEGIYRFEIVPSVPVDLPQTEIVEWINKYTVVAEVNEAFAAMYGLSPNDMIGKYAIEFAPDYGKRAALLLENDRYQVANSETMNIDNQGNPLWLRESYYGEIHDGRFSRIWGMQRDITERKKAEEEIFRMAQEWQQTFDAINAAVWILDKDYRIIRSNKAAELYFHRTPYEFIGKHCWEIVHGTDQPIPECPILRTKKSLQREKIDLQMGDNWFEVVVDPILDGAGQFAGAVHIVSDITDRKRAEEALNGSK